jgi:hypothetical protein
LEPIADITYLSPEVCKKYDTLASPSDDIVTVIETVTVVDASDNGGQSPMLVTSEDKSVKNDTDDKSVDVKEENLEVASSGSVKNGDKGDLKEFAEGLKKTRKENDDDRNISEREYQRNRNSDREYNWDSNKDRMPERNMNYDHRDRELNYRGGGEQQYYRGREGDRERIVENYKMDSYRMDNRRGDFRDGGFSRDMGNVNGNRERRRSRSRESDRHHNSHRDRSNGREKDRKDHRHRGNSRERQGHRGNGSSRDSKPKESKNKEAKLSSVDLAVAE